ncbi:MAG: c-type cytochrome [Arcobacter sp.]|uniref:c-type cytochrome n=1 Tax=Arcobacter sp. TaxID=1872629 RepID=UPI003AFFFEA7
MIRYYFKITVLFLLLNSLAVAKQDLNGEGVFKTYCWGCHHQTSVAFGPSFESIANKRTMGEIQGHIIAPKSTYKQLGHKRSVMPSFKEKLNQNELDAITSFILQYKSK